MPGLPKRVSLLSFTERVVVINGERRVIAEALVFIYRSVPGALAEFGGGDLVVSAAKDPHHLAHAEPMVMHSQCAGDSVRSSRIVKRRADAWLRPVVTESWSPAISTWALLNLPARGCVEQPTLTNDT